MSIKEIKEKTIQLIEEGTIECPNGYSYKNALTVASMHIGEINANPEPTQTIAALVKMVTQGMNPAVPDCYFIKNDNGVRIQESSKYNLKVARSNGLLSIRPREIYDSDKIEFDVDEMGNMFVKTHKTSISHRNGQVIGAYATTCDHSGYNTTVMTIEEIKEAWKQGGARGNSKAHRDFTGEMAKRTVANRAIKWYVEGSDELDHIIEQNKERERVISNEANGKIYSFDDPPEEPLELAIKPEKSKPVLESATKAVSAEEEFKF